MVGKINSMTNSPILVRKTVIDDNTQNTIKKEDENLKKIKDTTTSSSDKIGKKSKIDEQNVAKKEIEKSTKKKVDRYEARSEEEQKAYTLSKVSNEMKTMGMQNKVKKSLESNARILNSEIRIDKARGIDVSDKKKKLDDINKKLTSLKDAMKNTVKDVNESIKSLNSKEYENKKLSSAIAKKLNFNLNDNSLFSNNTNDLKNIQIYSISKGRLQTKSLHDMIADVMKKRMQIFV